MGEAVWRAYLDLSRTLHGIRTVDASGSLRISAHDRVEGLLRSLVAGRVHDQEEFDSWHRAACVELVVHFSHGGFSTFTVGQGQKWVNMALKYALTLAAVGWLRVRDPMQLRAVAHAPIDSFFLQGLVGAGAPKDMPRLGTAWSRIRDYDKYLQLQKWLRTNYQAPPLDLEFHVWQTVSSQRRPPPPVE
jgi:hypothetical protein